MDKSHLDISQTTVSCSSTVPKKLNTTPFPDIIENLIISNVPNEVDLIDSPRLAFPLPGIINDSDDDDEHVDVWQDVTVSAVQCNSSGAPSISSVMPHDRWCAFLLIQASENTRRFLISYE